MEERIRYYFILGYPAADIAAIVSNEYEEFELNPLGEIDIRRHIERNKDELKESQNKYLEECRESNLQDLRWGFTRAQGVENLIVKRYATKIEELVEELDKLDLSEKDEVGYFKNMGQYATLVMAINKTHETLERLSGTQAAREVMTHMKKAYVKEQAAKGAGMHGVAAEAEIVFMDDSESLQGFGPDFKSEGQGLPLLK